MIDVMLWADAWPHDVDFNGWPVGNIYLVHRNSTLKYSVSDEYPIAVFNGNIVSIDGIWLSDMSDEDLRFHGLERL